MRIVYISTSIIPSRYANSIHVMKMCNAFVKNGHDVILIAPDHKKEYEKNIDNIFEFYGVDESFKIIKVPYLPIRKIGPLLYSIFSQLHMRKNNPDLVYGRDFIGCLFAALSCCRTIFEAHEPLFNEGAVYKFLFTRLLNNKSLVKIIVISQALKNIFSQSNIVKDQGKISVAHDGADEQPDFQPVRNWPGRKKHLQAGYFGHLYEGRGIDIIIEISKNIKDVDFHIIGGNDNDIAHWKSRVNNTNLFFHGHVAPKIVYKYRNSCDILLAPYQKKVTLINKRDTSAFMSPLKIFEYMSSRKAIISSDLPVLREVLNDDISMLVTCDNVAEWTRAIEKLKNKKFRDAISKKSYNVFINNYTWQERARQVIRDNSTDINKKKITVAYVVSTLEASGPTNQLYNIIANIDRNKFIPIIITLSDEPANSLFNEFQKLGIELTSLKLSRLKGLIKAKNELKKILVKYNPDLVHTNGMRPDSLLYRLKKYKFITTVRGDYRINYPSKYGKIGYLMARYHISITKRFMYPIACSKSVSETFSTRYSIKMPYIQNGINTTIFYPVNHKQKIQIKKELGLPVNKKIFISVGSLDYRKDTETIIKGFTKAENNQRSLLLIAGTGEDFGTITKLTENRKNIILLGNVNIISIYLQASDFFVSTSLSEGLPNAVLEALGCGLPVILSDISPHREILEYNDGAGYLVKTKDYKDLSDKIDAIISADYSKLSGNANNIIEKYLNASRMSQQYQNKYKDILHINHHE